MSKAPRDEQSESGEAVVVKQERAAREFWIEMKNGAAWEFAEKPAEHRPCIHVIEKSAYDALQKERDELRSLLDDKCNVFNEHIDRWKNECDALKAELKFSDERRLAAIDLLKRELEQAKQYALDWNEVNSKRIETLTVENEELREELKRTDEQNKRLRVDSKLDALNEAREEITRLRAARDCLADNFNVQANELTRLRERIKELEPKQQSQCDYCKKLFKGRGIYCSIECCNKGETKKELEK